MKKLLFIPILLVALQLGAQTKSSGVKVIGTMTIKIDLNQATSTVTMTMTGPSTKWTTVGLNATTMSTNTPIDCFTYATTFLDQHLSGGHNKAITDTTQNLTLVSNTVTGTTRTVVVTRPFSTGDANDYTFNYAMTSLNIIWAVGPSTNFASEHATKGAAVLTFTTVLGTEEQSISDGITVYPNPSSGEFNINNEREQKIGIIKVYNIEAKMVKEINIESTNPNISVPLTGLTKGIYFLEISSGDSSTVKKIEIN